MNCYFCVIFVGLKYARVEFVFPFWSVKSKRVCCESDIFVNEKIRSIFIDDFIVILFYPSVLCNVYDVLTLYV